MNIMAMYVGVDETLVFFFRIINILSISYKLLVSNDTLTVFPSYMGIGVILVI